jgi:dipeptidyl aminopeptidase/acylaminoacyl peptidase
MINPKLVLALFLSSWLPVHAADKAKLTLDEFFNSVDIEYVRLSPDAKSLAIGTDRADWDQNIFRHDLWLYRDNGQGGGSLVQLTQSGHDTDPQWSPDGKWIAFLSERKLEKAAADSGDSDPKDKEEINQLYLISPHGGEAFPVTQGEEEVHAFSWSSDGAALYYATGIPWTKEQKDAYKKNWKDTRQYREAERPDVVFSLDLASALARHFNSPANVHEEEKASDVTPGSRQIANVPWRVQQLVTSPDGRTLALDTTSISQRQEKTEEFEIFAIDLGGSAAGKARQVTKNHAVEQHLSWAPDNRHVFFDVAVGDVSGPYRDLQPHLYWVDAQTGKTEYWSQDFVGSVEHYAVSSKGVMVAARQGTEVAVYSAANASDALSKTKTWPGTYAILSSVPKSPRVAFTYSALDRPTEVYVAESLDKFDTARPITSFNKLFTERDLPQGKPYRWKADDGTNVEGMLIYPPGRFEQKNLPMFTFIHGGPADADGNHFEADWYQWDRLAATQGWLVFEPNYRGSTGYGDKFLLGIVPQIVSRPGKDILAGVDALVKDGIADPQRLAVGGYSYGGYMTNWLITQTTRFRAAVTGAGAVEHVANWGNDDTTFDDAYFLGGRPWEAAQRYHDEAAIFQIDKVKTPTHMVCGADDIRVAVAENYLLEHALHSLGVPSSLLVFPGEGHSLNKNPWHGKIKVREELKWLEKYGGIGTAQ